MKSKNTLLIIKSIVHDEDVIFLKFAIFLF